MMAGHFGETCFKQTLSKTLIWVVMIGRECGKMCPSAIIYLASFRTISVLQRIFAFFWGNWVINFTNSVKNYQLVVRTGRHSLAKVSHNVVNCFLSLLFVLYKESLVRWMNSSATSFALLPTIYFSLHLSISLLL